MNSSTSNPPVFEGAAIYLFLSIDMDNSTAFKGVEPRWPFVLHHFYEDVVREMRGVCPHFNVWKYIGDEVTFWRRVQRGDDLNQLVRDTHHALERVRANLDRIEDDHRIKTKHVISAKGTMWTAAAEFVQGANLKRDLETGSRYPNRIIEEQHIIAIVGAAKTKEMRLYDFIGPNIDIGFRTSHFAHRGFLLISAGLAFLLLDRPKAEDTLADRMKIVSYEHLKGVWNERPYPIIWYADDWDMLDTKFSYDEQFTNPVVARVVKGDYQPVTNIESILRQTRHIETIDGIRHLLRAD